MMVQKKCPTCGERRDFKGMRVHPPRAKNWELIQPKLYQCCDPWHDESIAARDGEPLTEIEAMGVLGRATLYLGDKYPFIKSDVHRTTSERRAAELICALKDVIMFQNWADVKYEL